MLSPACAIDWLPFKKMTLLWRLLQDSWQREDLRPKERSRKQQPAAPGGGSACLGRMQQGTHRWLRWASKDHWCNHRQSDVDPTLKTLLQSSGLENSYSSVDSALIPARLTTSYSLHHRPAPPGPAPSISALRTADLPTDTLFKPPSPSQNPHQTQARQVKRTLWNFLGSRSLSPQAQEGQKVNIPDNGIDSTLGETS